MNDVRAWMDQGTKLFLSTVEGLGDAELLVPTGLRGWTRRHVIAHVHYNAEALRRLVSWAATGVESPMYASPEQRAREIEEGTLLPAARLRELVARSAAGLAEDLDRLTDNAWRAEVVTAQGRRIPATEIPWLRAREVAVHTIDLGAGVGFTDLTDELVEALLVDVVAKRARTGDGPALAAWLTGRVAQAPTLGPWL